MVEQEEFIFYAMHIYKILNSLQRLRSPEPAAPSGPRLR
jgi:hypothetical protein